MLEFILYLLGILLLATLVLYGLLYWLPKKLGFPRLAKVLSFGFLGLLAALIIHEMIKDDLFSKKDARKMLLQDDITLKHDFDLLRNWSTFAPGEYYHIFELKISNEDKKRIISEMRKIDGFQDGYKDGELWRTLRMEQDVKKEVAYESEAVVVKEKMTPSERKGYVPTYHIISINKETNVLTFEDIDE